MSDKRVFATEDALSAFTENANIGRYDGVVLYFSGTAASGVTPVIEDLGNIKVSRNDDTKMNRPVHVFADIMNEREGESLFDSNSGGNFEAWIKVYFYEQSFHQAWLIQRQNELFVSYDPTAGNPGNFASLDVEVAGSLAYKNEGYDYHILGNDQTPGGAWSNKPVTLPRNNITNVYMRDPGGIVTDIGEQQDGENRYSLKPVNFHKGTTILEGRLEQQTFDLVRFKNFTEDEKQSIMNNETIVFLSTSGGGNTVELTYTSMSA